MSKQSLLLDESIVFKYEVGQSSTAGELYDLDAGPIPVFLGTVDIPHNNAEHPSFGTTQKHSEAVTRRIETAIRKLARISAISNKMVHDLMYNTYATPLPAELRKLLS